MPSRRRIAAMTLAAAAVAVPIVGCGGSSNDSSTSAATSAAPAQPAGGSGGGGNTVDLAASEYKFTPSDTSVKSGDVTFNLKNDGQVAHSLEVEDVNGEDKEIEGDVSPGQSGSLKVNLPPGKYEFYCPVGDHRSAGMEGTLTVK